MPEGAHVRGHPQTERSDSVQGALLRGAQRRDSAQVVAGQRDGPAGDRASEQRRRRVGTAAPHARDKRRALLAAPLAHVRSGVYFAEAQKKYVGGVHSPMSSPPATTKARRPLLVGHHRHTTDGELRTVHYDHRVQKQEVWDGLADRTESNLGKEDLIKAGGKIVSKKRSEAMQRRIQQMSQEARKKWDENGEAGRKKSQASGKKK